MAKIKKVKIPQSGFRIHPSAEVFPMMNRKELDDLKASIEKNGLEEPIAVIGDQIIDGRNRYQVLKELGDDNVQGYYRDVSCRFLFQAEDTLTPIDYVVALNLHRRHLTPRQMPAIGIEVKKRKAVEAKERQGHGMTAPGKTLSDNCREPIDAGKASDQAGAMLGISGKSIERAEKVLESETAVPELKEAVRDGEVAVSSAAAIVDLPADKQREAVAGGKKGVAKAAKSKRLSDDELFEQAEKLVRLEGHGSVQMLQNKLLIGHARATKIIDRLQDAGVIDPDTGTLIENEKKTRETPQSVSTSVIPPERSVGIERGHDAINQLKKIPRYDSNLRAALKTVRSFCDNYLQELGD